MPIARATNSPENKKNEPIAATTLRTIVKPLRVKPAQAKTAEEPR
jgi:hypothetical protein